MFSESLEEEKKYMNVTSLFLLIPFKQGKAVLKTLSLIECLIKTLSLKFTLKNLDAQTIKAIYL